MDSPKVPERRRWTAEECKRYGVPHLAIPARVLYDGKSGAYDAIRKAKSYVRRALNK